MITPNEGVATRTDIPVSSGYLQRSHEQFPQHGTESPWRRLNNFLFDYFEFTYWLPTIGKEMSFK